MNLDSKIFRAYDIRGIYPSEINEKIVKNIISAFFTNQLKTINLKTVVIGRDARLSSPNLYRATISALKIKNLKLKIIPVGMCTTPMLSFLVNENKADFGIMVTASHNPKKYNGLKFFDKKGIPISGTEIHKIISS